jgi:hypothetical protein
MPRSRFGSAVVEPGDPVQLITASDDEAFMPRDAIIERIRLLIPVELNRHYDAVRHAFENGELTVPDWSISDIELGRAISEFTRRLPSEASIAALRKRIDGR